MFFVRISQTAVLLPFIIGLLRRKQLNREQRLLMLLICISFISEIAAFVLDNYLSLNNLVVYNFYNILWFVLLMLIYRPVFNYYFSSYVPYLLILGYTAFAVSNMLFFQPLSTFNSNSIGLSLSVFMALSLLFFHKDLTSSVNLTVKNRPMLWLNTGIFLYSSGTLLLFLFINPMIESGSGILPLVWSLNVFLNVLLNGFYAMALWIKAKEE
tara:strand:+ start:1063 stop:1698 length:636 start_codon:yes stop_codon:yes gene_type:complete